MKKLSIYMTIIITLILANNPVRGSRTRKRLRPRSVNSPRAELSLKDVPFKIVHETYRETEGRQNWELFLMNADGSNPVNLTNTPGVDGQVMTDITPQASVKLGRELADGTYQPQPVKRTYIPKKGSSKKRPLGIPILVS